MSTLSRAQIKVSIQLVSPASGDFKLNYYLESSAGVSIQLVSPASGDLRISSTTSHVRGRAWFPFNWFPQRVGTTNDSSTSGEGSTSFHSIGFPSEWGHPATLIANQINIGMSFHSIGFPSEWGHDRHSGTDTGMGH